MQNDWMSLLAAGNMGLIRRSRVIKAMEIFRQIIDDELTEEQMQAVIDHVNPFVPELLKPYSFEQARAILGKEKVYGARDAHKRANRKMDQAHSVLYSRETLEQCAADNASGHSDWRLVFMFPWTYKEIRDQLRDFSFEGAWGQCQMHAQGKWGKRRPQVGYTLCNFVPTFQYLSYSYLHENARKRQPKEKMARVVELMQILATVSREGFKKDKKFAFHCELTDYPDKTSYFVHLNCDVFEMQLFPPQSKQQTEGAMMIMKQELTESEAALRLLQSTNK